MNLGVEILIVLEPNTPSLDQGEGLGLPAGQAGVRSEGERL